MSNTPPVVKEFSPLASQVAGRFIVACENDDCAANPQVCADNLQTAWERWNTRL